MAPTSDRCGARRGDRHLTAEAAGRLVEVHLVAAQGCGAGRLEPARTATRDEHPLVHRRPDDGSKLTVVSSAAATFTTHDSVPVDIRLPTQPKLEPMHGRIRLSSPVDAPCSPAPGRRSAPAPSRPCRRRRSATMCSAWSSVMIRPTTIVGFVDDPRDHLVDRHLAAERIVHRRQQLVEPPVRPHVQRHVVDVRLDELGDLGDVLAASGHPGCTPRSGRRIPTQ